MLNVGQVQILLKYKHAQAVKISIIRICNDILVKAVWGRIPVV